jgi:hypothetical protein
VITPLWRVLLNIVKYAVEVGYVNFYSCITSHIKSDVNILQVVKYDQFVKFAKPRRQIKTRTSKDFVSQNILEKRACNNIRALIISTARSKQYNNSFFVKSAIDWNPLPDAVVQAGSPEAFKIALKEHRRQ